MKKLNYLALAALAATAMNMNAEGVTFGNPKDAEGNYIVKWDPAKQAFAESNDWEIDETIIFAIDLTGTPLADAIKQPSRNPAVLGRGLAYDLYVTSCPEETTGKKNIDGRLMHIKDNVYGMTVNFFQQHTTRYADEGFLPNSDYSEYEATKPGAETTWNANIFPFGWSADNPGAEWWDGVATPIQGEFQFGCAAYTGTKTSPEFFYSDVTPEDYSPFEGLPAAAFNDMVKTWGGYADPKFYNDAKTSAVESIAVETQTVSSEYFDLQGRKVANPGKGIYIRQDLKSDGSVKSVKVLK